MFTRFAEACHILCDAALMILRFCVSPHGCGKGRVVRVVLSWCTILNGANPRSGVGGGHHSSDKLRVPLSHANLFPTWRRLFFAPHIFHTLLSFSQWAILAARGLVCPEKWRLNVQSPARITSIFATNCEHMGTSKAE